MVLQAPNSNLANNIFWLLLGILLPYMELGNQDLALVTSYHVEGKILEYFLALKINMSDVYLQLSMICNLVNFIVFLLCNVIF